jgi:hypothetical protein
MILRMVDLPESLRVKRWPRRTASKVECLRAGVLLYFSAGAFGPMPAFDCYAKARNGKRDFWNAVHGLCMINDALVRNLRAAREAKVEE